MDRIRCANTALMLTFVACASDATTLDDTPDKLTTCLSTPAPARLRCDLSQLKNVSWGSEVEVVRGSGKPPAPAGGTLVDGSYQLVAETQYGDTAPDVSSTSQPGGTVRRVLFIANGVANELYEASDATESGNDCWTLTPQPICLINLSGWTTSGDLPLTADLRDHMSYSAHKNRLTLIQVLPYTNASALQILGSTTLVDEFARVSHAGETAAVLPPHAGKEPPTSHSRDARCPDEPPADGDPCSPVPAPLECEYGGDTWGRCTTFTACSLGFDGVFRFATDPATDCTLPNAAECPATFSEASETSAISDELAKATCNYEEGVCACAPNTGAGFRRSCDWTCRAASSVINAGTRTPCPWPRPLAGDPCSAGDDCAYDEPCDAGTSLGPQMVCRSGHWSASRPVSFGCGP
jgi:hypothetical protein